MVLNLLLLLAGTALLWFSSEAVVRSVPPVARRLGISELTVTILGVSVFSSLPELSVSALAAVRGAPDVSLGNVVGSNFATLTFVTALCALIAPLNMRREIRDRESSWMILSSVVILLLAADGMLSRVDGLILVGLYVPYLWAVLTGLDKAEPAVVTAGGRRRVWPSIVVGVAGVAGVIAGADLALRGGQAFATRLGIPPLVLGAVIFAFGTSLPEMAIAVTATLRKKAEISMGEIYSSNIFTALAILGICCLIHPLALGDLRVLSIDLPFLILAGVVVQIFITTGMVLSRVEAAAVLGLYAYYVLVHLKPELAPWKF